MYKKNIDMQIHNTKQLKELQEDFNNTFPYLKIEFFSQPHDVGEGSDEKNILNNQLTVGEIRRNNIAGFIPLNDNMPVGFFEKLLESSFQLNIQVYRKSHGKWLQTWASDVWTLGEQNKRSKIIGDIDDLLAS